MIDEPVIRGDEDPSEWFREHYEDAADQILRFLAEDGISIARKAVADIGCGDGIIDLALVMKGRPAKLVGYDIRPTDTDALARAAAAAGIAEALPEELTFVDSAPAHVPVEDDAFDVVVTWSVFEHVTYPERMLAEISRILKPDGVLFIQLWPFYYSEHGGHLWPHYQESFPHLLHEDDAIREHVRGRRGTDPTRGDAVEEYDSLNRITVDDLQRGLLAAGLIVGKLELLTSAVHVPRELGHLSLSLLGTAGIKLLAVPV
jgi:SAM-dependent methyltransferase